MKRKIVSILAMLLLVSLLLTGCQQGGLCSLAGTMGGKTNKSVASVTIGEDTKYAETFIEAWNVVNSNTDKDVTVKLLKDITADKGSFGRGSEEGLKVAARNGAFVLDMDGKTINKALTEENDCGYVFCFDEKANITIKNGTIKGGKNTGTGGGMYICNDDLTVKLDGVTFDGNSASLGGGGIYIDACKAKVTLKDCTVKNNETMQYGGGVMVQSGTNGMSLLTLEGKTVIDGNSGSLDRKNLALGKYPGNGSQLSITGLTANSKIGISFIDEEEHKITCGLGGNAAKLKEYFTSDSSDFVLGTDGDCLVLKSK